MWYVSANRDETVFARPNEFLIDRENAQQHLSLRLRRPLLHGQPTRRDAAARALGGDHARFRFVEVVGEPVRVKSPFVKGFAKLPVRVHPW